MTTLQFLAENPVHVNVRSEDAQYNSTGRKVKTLQRRIFAKFNRGIPAWAVPLAETTFDFSHMPPERTVEQWCGFYDSEGDQIRMDWTDEERETIEARLVDLGYLLVEKPKAPAPYPTYAKQRRLQGQRTVKHVIEDIKATLEQTGIDPGDVIAYEVDHLDKDSQAIIDAFTKAATEAEAEEMVTA